MRLFAYHDTKAVDFSLDIILISSLSVAYSPSHWHKQHVAKWPLQVSQCGLSLFAHTATMEVHALTNKQGSCMLLGVR